MALRGTESADWDRLQRARSSAPTISPPPATAPPAEASPPTSATVPTAVPFRGTTQDLDRDPGQTPRDPHAAREISRRQALVASELTGPSISEQPSFFAASPQATPGIPPRVVADPLHEEQRTSIETPELFQPGTPLPPVPDLTGQQPTRTEPLQEGGTRETFERDGVTYTRTTQSDGTVTTSYADDGTNYSSTAYQDGRSSRLLTTSDETGSHSRSLEFDPQGQPQSDSSTSTQSHSDPQSQQSRTRTLDAQGVETTTETVLRPDGGRSELTSTRQPDGSVRETYSYQGDQGSLSRSSNQAPDGSAETRTERNYRLDQPLESLVSADRPAVPEHARNIVPLPSTGRGPTEVREVEVVATDTSGNHEVQYSETSHSQSSTAVQVHGTPNSPDLSLDTLPTRFNPNPDGTSITRTVTTVSVLNSEGELETSTGESQTLTLAARRWDQEGGAGGGDVSVTRTDSWNADGESSTSNSLRGFRNNELGWFADQADREEADALATNLWEVVVGDQQLSVAPPPGSGFSEHLDRKKDRPGEWLGEDPQQPIDVDGVLNRNPDGSEASSSVSWSNLDENGDGRSVTRSDSGATVGWTYSDHENHGQDYRRQTVFEGNRVSVYEEHAVTGPGTFRTSTETRNDQTVTSTSSASRQEITEADLRQEVAKGALTQAQLDRMLQDGPPYYAERFNENAQPILDANGAPLVDDNGNPLQPGHDASSLRLANTAGYSVSDHSRYNNPTSCDNTGSRLRTVTDPLADPPLSGLMDSGKVDEATGEYAVNETGALTVGRDGQVSFDGLGVGGLELGGADFSTLLRRGDLDPFSVIRALGGANGPDQEVSLPGTGGGTLTLSDDPANLNAMRRFNGIFGVAGGVQAIFPQPDPGQFAPFRTVKGVAGIAGNVSSVAGKLSSLAAATGALPGQLGGVASRFSSLAKPLGKALGGAVHLFNVGFGLYDMFNADTQPDRAAGGLSAAAGGIAFAALFGGPPGWVMGLVTGGLSLAALAVEASDDCDTANIDDRMR
jgi:hypothetical protein